MCFKKPKAPKPTAEEVALQQEAADARENARRQLADELAKEKEARTYDAVQRGRGAYGVRSLISGWKGGGGFSLRSLIG